MTAKPTQFPIGRMLVAVLALLACAAPLRADDDERQGYRLAPKAFRAAVDKVSGSLVTIETYGGVQPGARRTPGGISRPGDGPTTGVIISPDGYIITSTFNFITRPPVITVILPDGTYRVATMLGRDETRKLCLLKIDGVDDLPVPEFVSRDELRVGQWAITAGVGFGAEQPAIAAGIISATSRVSGMAVQTDANISPANYGGPLLDIEGRVIGICVPLSPMAQGTAGGVEWYDSGIGFAIPLAGADRLIAHMKDGREVRPGRLGVRIRPAGDDGLGVEIEGVQNDSPAAESGIEPGDHIVAVNDQDVLDLQQLRAAIGRYVAGDTIRVTIERDGERRELEVELAFIADEEPARPLRVEVPSRSAEPEESDESEEEKEPEAEPENESEPEPETEPGQEGETP